MADLPSEILAKAFRAPNGELAWRPDDVPEVIEAFVGLGQAVWGAELWWVQRPSWMGLVPTSDGSPPGVWSWEPAPQTRDEAWSDYVERTAGETREAMRVLDLESWVHPDVLPGIYFNLEGVAEGDA